MMTTPGTKRARRDMQNRVAAVLLFATATLTSLGWTGAAWAQADVRRIGFLSFLEVSDDPTWEQWIGMFRRNLSKHGWIEGNNVAFEFRTAHSDPSRFAKAAEELIGLKVDVILAGSAPVLRAAHATIRDIPIVAIDYTNDPVAAGYAKSYARPGGNVTGVFLDAPEFAGKWFELLRAMIPDLSRMSVLWDPGPGATHLQAARSVASSLDINLQVLEVRKPDDIDTAFAALRGRPQAVIFLPSPMIFGQSARLARLALKHQLPATSMAPEFADAGGVIAYGPDPTSTIERIASLVAKVLAGGDPAELPVERPTKFQLVLNLTTANALGITIPQSILFRADQVIK